MTTQLVLAWGSGYLRERPAPEVPPAMAGRVLEAHGYDGPGQLSVFVTIDNTPKWGPLKHVSIAYPRRDPSWAEIKRVRDLFFAADEDVMMVLPRQADYVNVHPHAFHLWQTPQGWEIR